MLRNRSHGRGCRALLQLCTPDNGSQIPSSATRARASEALAASSGRRWNTTGANRAQALDGGAMTQPSPRARLQLPLRLLVRAHDAERAEEVAVGVGRERGHDGVVGPLVRRQAVGVPRVQDEAVAAVVQREAAAVRHDACARRGAA